MGTRADFFVGVGPTAEWIGSTSYDGSPTAFGAAPLAARSEAEFRAAVERMLSTPDLLVTRPAEGWPWPWEDLRGSDYAYAWDPAGTALVCSGGRRWVTAGRFAADPEGLRLGAPLRDDEVPDMRRIPRGDIWRKSGLTLIRGAGAWGRR